MILQEYEALSRDGTASNTYQAGKLNLIWCVEGGREGGRKGGREGGRGGEGRGG